VIEFKTYNCCLVSYSHTTVNLYKLQDFYIVIGFVYNYTWNLHN